jgi:hypothetical protein
VILGNLGCLTAPSMLLESIGYDHEHNCHGRGRGFEPRRPRHKPQENKRFMARDKKFARPEGAIDLCAVFAFSPREGADEGAEAPSSYPRRTSSLSPDRRR